MKVWATAVLAVCLAACQAGGSAAPAAKTVQQNAAYQQDLQVRLAALCDQETADLMREYFLMPEYADAGAKQAFNLRYMYKLNAPMFQNCYQLAWQNYVLKQRFGADNVLLDQAAPFMLLSPNLP